MTRAPLMVLALVLALGASLLVTADAVPGPPAADPAPLAPSSVDPPLTPSEEAPSITEVVKLVFGLVGILALAFLGGHPRVRALEERFRITHVVAAGFPFVVLGIIARNPRMRLLEDSTLDAMRPIVPFGLGWIGFALGFRFDAGRLVSRPPFVGLASWLVTLVPFGLCLLASGLAFALVYDTTDPSFLRHALILAVATVITGRTTAVLPRGTTYDPVADRVTHVTQLGQLIAVVGLGFVAAFFRPSQELVAWRLPGVAWIFMTLGLSFTVGMITYATLSIVTRKSEAILTLLGTIAFSAGLASYLRLSPTVVCFVAGVVVANIPSASRHETRATLDRLEAPVYLVFLFLVGAQAQFDQSFGWILLSVFVVCRLVGKAVGAGVLGRASDFDPVERRALRLAPVGALAIAAAISAYDLYPGLMASSVVTAVVGGAIVTEITVQVFARRSASSSAPAPTERTT